MVFSRQPHYLYCCLNLLLKKNFYELIAYGTSIIFIHKWVIIFQRFCAWYMPEVGVGCVYTSQDVWEWKTGKVIEREGTPPHTQAHTPKKIKKGMGLIDLLLM